MIEWSRVLILAVLFFKFIRYKTVIMIEKTENKCKKRPVLAHLKNPKFWGQEFQ